jgi:hypothetical protein
VQDVRFEVKDLSRLGDLLGISPILENAVYELSEDEVKDLSCCFGLAIKIPASCSAQLRSHHWTDELPYKVHTRSELALMLDGVKPLAVFSDQYPPGEYSVIPEKAFDSHVETGRFVKRSYVALSKNGHSLRVLYSLPTEEWRIDAYILMWNTASRSGWNNGFERMEGYLLGYEEWQCDAYFAIRQKRKA